MSTVRLDPKHAKMLDDLKAKMILEGKKLSKQEIIGKLIESAINDDDLILKKPVIEDNIPADLVVFDWAISDSSTTVDEHLYQLRRKKGDM